jgi:hypothetical protein
VKFSIKKKKKKLELISRVQQANYSLEINFSPPPPPPRGENTLRKETNSLTIGKLPRSNRAVKSENAGSSLSSFSFSSLLFWTPPSPSLFCFLLSLEFDRCCCCCCCCCYSSSSSSSSAILRAENFLTAGADLFVEGITEFPNRLSTNQVTGRQEMEE